MTAMTKRRTTWRQLSRFAQRERGSQLVELAIVLPIMLMTLASIAEFGNFFYTYTTLAKATRGGARYLVSKPYSAVEQSKAASLAVYGNSDAGCLGTPVLAGLTCANVSVTSTGGAAGYPDRVSVRVVNYTYQPLFDLGKLTNKTITLKVPVSPSTTMKYLLF
jgi:Flp pilus assembly protein TadG